MSIFYLSLPYCISFEYSVVCSSAELSVHKLDGIESLVIHLVIHDEMNNFDDSSIQSLKRTRNFE
jgi:hypothetical protein